MGAPDDFEFEVDWKCLHPDCFTTSPVLLVYQAYDADGNVLWEDYLLLRTVKCADTLTSPITIEDYLPLPNFCAVTAVTSQQPRIQKP